MTIIQSPQTGSSVTTAARSSAQTGIIMLSLLRTRIFLKLNIINTFPRCDNYLSHLQIKLLVCLLRHARERCKCNTYRRVNAPRSHL